MKFLAVFILAVAATVTVEAAQPYLVPIYRVLMDATSTTTTTAATPTGRVVFSPKGMPGHTFEHVCSGTLVDDSSIITTVTCIQLAGVGTEMNAYVATAAEDTSVDGDNKVFYEVLKVVTHPDYDSATNENNIAVLKLTSDVDYSLSDKVSHITWSLAVPSAEAKCVASYWSAATPFAQVNQDVTVKACSPVKDGAICSTFTSPPAQCPAGANGGSLVCDSKLAGIFTSNRNADCSAALWQYEELSKDAEWIWMSVSAAPILNVSFAAILALVTAMLKSL